MASVSLNGVHLGDANDAFVRWRFAVPSCALVSGPNTLTVAIAPAKEYAGKQAAAYPCAAAAHSPRARALLGQTDPGFQRPPAPCPRAATRCLRRSTTTPGRRTARAAAGTRAATPPRAPARTATSFARAPPTLDVRRSDPPSPPAAPPCTWPPRSSDTRGTSRRKTGTVPAPVPPVSPCLGHA